MLHFRCFPNWNLLHEMILNRPSFKWIFIAQLSLLYQNQRRADTCLQLYILFLVLAIVLYIVLQRHIQLYEPLSQVIVLIKQLDCKRLRALTKTYSIEREITPSKKKNETPNRNSLESSVQTEINNARHHILFHKNHQHYFCCAFIHTRNRNELNSHIICVWNEMSFQTFCCAENFIIISKC